MQLSPTLLLALAINVVISMDATAVSNYCHCDLTTAFCDMDCCCDADCSLTIDSNCFLAKSSIFCLNSSYYFKIDSTLTPSAAATDCYYYNKTSSLQQQVNISSNQLNNIVSANTNEVPLPTNFASIYKSYQIAMPLTIGGKKQFQFIDANGNCVVSDQTSNISNIVTSIKYRMNLDIVCVGSINNINLYNNLLGKIILSYSDSSDVTVAIPLVQEQYNEANIYIFVAQYGSMNGEYIQNVQVKVSNGASNNTQTLRVRFINPLKEVQQQESSPSFFPQIPTDIFFPLQQIAYSI